MRSSTTIAQNINPSMSRIPTVNCNVLILHEKIKIWIDILFE